MAAIQAYLQELDQEAQTTRRVLARVPGDKLGWKPHEKSMSLGQLAQHIATLPGNIAELVSQPTMQLPQFNQPSAASATDLVPALDASLAKAKQLLGAMDDSALGATWRILRGDEEVMAMPRGAVLRAIMLNHWYHHRGQLSVYLRQLGVPVPSIYGPSADENPFAS
ncbi:MAG: DinB family protein [Vicinamibacterales bacterium]